MEYRMNTGGEQEVSQFATVAPRGNGNGGIIHARRRVVSHAISGMGTIDDNCWCCGGCGGRGSHKATKLGIVTSPWYEGERRRGTHGSDCHSRGIWSCS